MAVSMIKERTAHPLIMQGPSEILETAPRHRSQTRRIIWGLMLFLLGLGLLRLGPLKSRWPKLVRQARHLIQPQGMAASAGGRYATTDTYLSVLQIPHPSEAVLAALTDVPANEAILFVGPSQEPSFGLTYQVISYLSWPRPAGAVECGQSGQPPVWVSRPREGTKIGALLFYRLNPPAQIKESRKTIGPHLTLVPVSEQSEWISSYLP